MAIKLLDSGGGVDELAKAIPTAIQGYYDAQDRDMKRKMLAAKMMADEDKKERQMAEDRLKLEQAGYDTSGHDDPMGMLKSGLLSKREGFISDQDLKRSQVYANYQGQQAKDLEMELKSERLKQMKDPTKKYNDAQKLSAGFAKRSEQAEGQLEDILNKYDVSSKEGFVDAMLPGSTLFNAMKSSERKQLEQAAHNFITAVLRKESGAAIPPEEIQAEYKKYIPQPGDDPKTIAQKSQARKQAIENLKGAAGGAMGIIQEAEYIPPDETAETGGGKPPWEDYGG